MKKLIAALGLLFTCACATQPIQPEILQSKLALGMSSSDVMGILGLPLEKSQTQLTYTGYVLIFADNKLTSVQATSNEHKTDLEIKNISQQNPSYTPDSLILNKELKLEVSAFQIAGYLHDENLFLKAVDAGVNRNGFTVRSNALCVALAEGFSKGAEAVMKAGYNPDLQLRTDKGVYIFPPNCVAFQKDPALAAQYKKQVDESVKSAPKAVGPDGKTEESKSLFDWQEVKDFLKPTAPPPTSNINR